MSSPDPGAAGAFPLGPGLPEAVRGALVGVDAAAAREQLANDVVGWLTTIAADGRPQTSVIPFLWDGDGILFYSRLDTPTVRNIAASGAVSFHLNCDPYGDHVVIVDGRAHVTPLEKRSDVHSAYAAKYREPHAHWGMDEHRAADEFSLPIRIHPERVRLW
ncbi:MAG TPA: pyridoxamine 5'-phosphate oxidase family protein [Candidatus Nanopelagicales bacterium]|nr:pyridoxamine 5'-phosphate oxidase family protein [Candidatus Nanopelagicales bacterium]